MKCIIKTPGSTLLDSLNIYSLIIELFNKAQLVGVLVETPNGQI